MGQELVSEHAWTTAKVVEFDLIPRLNIRENGEGVLELRQKVFRVYRHPFFIALSRHSPFPIALGY